MSLDKITAVVAYLGNLFETDSPSFLDLVNVCNDRIDDSALERSIYLVDTKVIEKKIIFVPLVKGLVSRMFALGTTEITAEAYAIQIRENLEQNEEALMDRLHDERIDRPIFFNLHRFFQYKDPLQSMLSRDEKELFIELGLAEEKWVVNDPDIKRCVLLAVTGETLDDMELGSVLPEEQLTYVLK